MRRLSEEKLILDKEKYDQYKLDYNNLILELKQKFKVSVNKNKGALVNFKLNNQTPKHSWLKYKEGYSSTLVNNILKENDFPKDKIILDPFCGVGTTNLVAQQNGYKSIGFDINPVAILAAKCKTEFYSKNDINSILDYDNYLTGDKQYKFKEFPKVLSTSFSEQVLNDLLRLKQQILEIENNKIKDLVNLAYISIIEDCSIRIKDGNGIKLKKNKKFITNPRQHLIMTLEKIVSEIRAYNCPTEVEIIEDSSIDNLEKYLDDSSVSLSVFSPPYANCFDYLEVYKLEVWLGGFADEYKDFKQYRNKAMRSHVNSKFSHEFAYKNDKVRKISELISCFNIWNKNIPDMINGYFDDTYQLLRKLYPKMVKNGKVYIIVANSVYKGVIVPTDLIISDIASELGFRVNDITMARRIRSSSQQITEIKHDDLMRESIIELQK